MLRFQDIEWLWLWLVIPLVVLLFIIYRKRRNDILAKMGDSWLVNRMIPAFHGANQRLKLILICIGLFAGVLGLANLQGAAHAQKVKRKGIDVVIALDVSKSMLARDIAPDRLQAAKQCISKLLDKIGNNRIGLILFAGRAYMSVPLTVDISALKMNLTTASPQMVPSQGTVLGEAIAMARKTFNAKDLHNKSLILISDGEDHDEQALKEVKQAIEEGIKVYTVGIGSENGSTIFDPETGKNKLDQQGQEVVSKLNEKELQEIAQVGNGAYHRFYKADKTADLLAQDVQSAQQQDFGDALLTDYESYFQYFILIALVFFLIEFFIPETKTQTA